MTVVTERTQDTALSRRRILQGVAWAAPAVIVASATPAAAASVDPTKVLPANELPGTWQFAGDGSSFNDGMYDLKSGMRRIASPAPTHPKYDQGINAPYDGAAAITVLLTIRLNAMDGSVPFFSVDPLNPFAGANPITLSAQATGWVIGGSSYQDGVLTVAFVNTATYVDFSSGRAIQNVYVSVPTTNKVNNRNKDGSAHMAASFSSPAFTTRTDDPLRK